MIGSGLQTSLDTCRTLSGGGDGPEEAGQSQWILGSAVRDPHSNPHGSYGRRV